MDAYVAWREGYQAEVAVASEGRMDWRRKSHGKDFGLCKFKNQP